MDLHQFKALNKVSDPEDYISALELFDSIPQLQELKSLAATRCAISNGKSVLDVGCGFGLETLRLAKLVAPNGKASGIDTSRAFVAEAKKRASASESNIGYEVADARSLPFVDKTFDCVRAERILIYLQDFSTALSEMQRVLKSGGKIALIEPDFSTTTINVENRRLMRRILDYEVAHAVEQSWLPGPLLTSLQDFGFVDVEIATRVLIFPLQLAATYFIGAGKRALTAKVIDHADLSEWEKTIDSLQKSGQLFATIGYFLFTARRP